MRSPSRRTLLPKYGWQLGAMLAALVTLVVTTASPASAHYFGLIKTDNNYVLFASDEDTNDDYLFWNHFVHYQQYNQYEARTDLDVAEQPRWGWGDTTDIVWFAADLGPSVFGDYECRKVVNGRCERGRLRFNEAATRQISGDAGFFLACHELGHAYGFQHYNNGCMHGSGQLHNPPNDGTLSSHMISHINGYY